jgi:hypothetical protein
MDEGQRVSVAELIRRGLSEQVARISGDMTYGEAVQAYFESFEEAGAPGALMQPNKLASDQTKGTWYLRSTDRLMAIVTSTGKVLDGNRQPIDWTDQ